VSQELAVRVLKGRARRLALFCRSRLSAVWVVDLDNRRKKEGRWEPWVPVQEGRERKLVWLDSRKLRRPGGYRRGFHMENLIIKGWAVLTDLGNVTIEVSSRKTFEAEGAILKQALSDCLRDQLHSPELCKTLFASFGKIIRTWLELSGPVAGSLRLP
jgi:hypothetical protein